MKKQKNKEKGFTLVELIIVIAILATLAALIVPKIMGNVKDSDKQKDITNAQTIAGQVTIHNAKAGPSVSPIPNALPSPGATKELLASDLTGTDCALPADIDFPKSSVVKIIIDSSGNASIDKQ